MTAELTSLRQIPLLRSLSEENLLSLRNALIPIRKNLGDILFRQGEPGDSLYFILEGRVRFTFRHNTGMPNSFEEIGPGQCFGEVAVFSLFNERTATAEVTESLYAYELKREDLRQCIQAHPEVALALLAAMAERLQRSGKQLQQAPPRKVSELVEQSLTPRDRLARWFAQTAGSSAFIAFHAMIVVLWIAGNSLGGESAFDPFPFGFLGLIFGVEALILSCFVLMNQHREDKADAKRDAEEYRINVIAGMEVSHLHERLDDLQREISARFPERSNGNRQSTPR